jgi:N-acetyl-anhydromuramyl-L-alanine amidase AmpD
MSLVLHHTADPGAERQADKVIAYHKRKFGVAGAYHYLIEPDAFIVQLHREDLSLPHAGNWLYNQFGIAVCLAGDFTRHSPTEAQIEALAKLTMEIQNRWGIPDSSIFLHREVRSTACPGIDLRALIFEERKKILQTRMERLQLIYPRLTGSRKQRVLRLINRLLRQFG